jgi:hypothetical protein
MQPTEPAKQKKGSNCIVPVFSVCVLKKNRYISVWFQTSRSLYIGRQIRILPFVSKNTQCIDNYDCYFALYRIHSEKNWLSIGGLLYNLWSSAGQKWSSGRDKSGRQDGTKVVVRTIGRPLFQAMAIILTSAYIEGQIQRHEGKKHNIPKPRCQNFPTNTFSSIFTLDLI